MVDGVWTVSVSLLSPFYILQLSTIFQIHRNGVIIKYLISFYIMYIWAMHESYNTKPHNYRTIIICKR